MFFDHEHEVSADDAEYLATMAELCGQALERALLADAESRARERAEETARYATSLYSLGMRLAGALTPPGCRCHGHARGDRSARSGSRGRRADRRAAPGGGVARRRRLPAGGARHSAAFQSRCADLPPPPRHVPPRPSWSGRWRSASQRFPRLPKALGAGSVAIARLPLRVADRTFGVLILRYTGERAFGSDERRFLLTLADDYSDALDRARLHAETERLYEREHRIAETLQASFCPAEFPLASWAGLRRVLRTDGGRQRGRRRLLRRLSEGVPATPRWSETCVARARKRPGAPRVCRYTLRAAGMLAVRTTVRHVGAASIARSWSRRQKRGSAPS